MYWSFLCYSNQLRTNTFGMYIETWLLPRIFYTEFEVHRNDRIFVFSIFICVVLYLSEATVFYSEVHRYNCQYFILINIFLFKYYNVDWPWSPLVQAPSLSSRSMSSFWHNDSSFAHQFCRCVKPIRQRSTLSWHYCDCHFAPPSTIRENVGRIILLKLIQLLIAEHWYTNFSSYLFFFVIFICT